MYKLTANGRKIAYGYIDKLKAKRVHILSTKKDTCDITNLPTIEDIEKDITNIGINWNYPGGPCYFNGWRAADHTEADYPLFLKFGQDIVDTDYIPSDKDEYNVVETYAIGTFFNMIPGSTVKDNQFGNLWKVKTNKPTIELEEVTLNKIPGMKMSFSNVTRTPFIFSLLTKTFADVA